MSIATVLLAAGYGDRFGSDKRLHPIGGEPMLFKTIRVYQTVFEHVFVVVRRNETELIEKITELGANTAGTYIPGAGQSHSLSVGVRAASAHEQIAIGLGDMPFVRTETLRAVVAAAEQHPKAVVRPRHDGTPGHPVVFPLVLHADLLDRDGDEGGRQVIRDYAETVVFVDVDDAGTVTDVDQPEDLDNA